MQPVRELVQDGLHVLALSQGFNAFGLLYDDGFEFVISQFQFFSARLHHALQPFVLLLDRAAEFSQLDRTLQPSDEEFTVDRLLNEGIGAGIQGFHP